MKSRFAGPFCLSALLMGLMSPSIAGGIDDLNCTINSIFGSDCSEIQRINKFQDQQQQAWINGSLSATDMVNSIINFHRSLTSINSYDKELYMYNLQVARVCDAKKITKEEGLYLMAKKENELTERVQANQPPPNRQLACVSESFGSQVTTKCK